MLRIFTVGQFRQPGVDNPDTRTGIWTINVKYLSGESLLHIGMADADERHMKIVVGLKLGGRVHVAET